MKSTTFWDITPCSPLSVNRLSEEHIAFIFRVENISSARNQLASRTFSNDREDGSDMFLRNVG
jgi:hypothetical protein